MLRPGPEWQFVRNEAGEIASNDGNIAHFAGDRHSAIIRETIQNSLDAADDLREPVTVVFERITLRRHHFGAERLAAAFKACIESDYVGERDAAAFLDAKRDLERESIDTLAIRDINTTGASDQTAKDSGISMWEALTKSSGVNEKPGSSGKMGSWGLGKNASFAASRFRTALYATAFRQQPGLSSPSSPDRWLFQGKAVLVSHRIDGILYNPVGYLGNRKFEPLRDNEVPEMFKLKSVGTAIWIPGYTFADSWEDDSVVAAIRSFFHAIERDRLRLEIGSVSLNCENIRKFSDRDSKTSRMLAVVSEKAQARKEL